jgi:Tfp pilus assembly protein PilF
MTAIRNVVGAAIVILMLAPPMAAQQLATEQDRREALQSYRVGLELLSGEQFEKAAEQFAKAVQRDELLTRAHYALGQSYMGLRRYASAAKAYRDCLQAFQALHALQQTHRFVVERQREDEIKELNENIRRLTQAGQTLRATQAEARLRDLERQKTALEAAYQPPAAVLLALGSALFRNGDAETATRHWEEAVAADPRLGEGHNNLAVVYMQTSRFAEADAEIKAAEKAGFRVNPQLKEDLKKARARP